jgi:hypothetical protein
MMRRAIRIAAVLAGGSCFLALLWVIAVFVVTYRPANITYPRLGSVARIEILVRGEVIKEIEDRGQIDAVASFVDGRRSGWHTSWHTMPAPLVIASFQSGPSGDRYFGVGRGEFIAYGGGNPNSLKSASDEECRRFLGLIGVERSRIEERDGLRGVPEEAGGNPGGGPGVQAGRAVHLARSPGRTSGAAR